jgi:hypothetical protein
VAVLLVCDVVIFGSLLVVWLRQTDQVVRAVVCGCLLVALVASCVNTAWH